MFTGLIEKIAVIKNIARKGDMIDFTFSADNIGEGVNVGDSVAVNGVCLTAVDCKKDSLVMQAMSETLKTTTLKHLNRGDKVNIERSMKLGDRLGGHMVSGHIDGIGKIIRIDKGSDNLLLKIESYQDIIAQLIDKGSVAVDGVSLTVQKLASGSFTVAIIPHTLSQTNLQYKKVGDLVNIEIDQIAKYVKKFTSKITTGKLTETYLKAQGF